MHATPTRPSRRSLFGLVAVAALAAACLIVPATAGWIAPAASTELPPPPPAATGIAFGGTGSGSDDTLDADDGILPEGTSALDDGLAGIDRLDGALLDALQAASADAATEGVALVVNSGWRSPAHQDRLLQDAVAEHGSAAEAARWVATADTSAHVSGDAVDVGPPAAAAWLAEHGDRYGLCRVYDNEPWHFELRTAALSTGCPSPYADPTADPRMQ